MPQKNQIMQRLDATEQQAHFARLVGEQGMGQTDAATLAYPNTKYPAHAGTMAMKSVAVLKLITQYQLKGIKMEASGLSYQVLTAMCKDKSNAVSDTNKIKAAIALHDKFGFGRVKPKKGEDPFNADELSDEDLDEFIAKTKKEILELEGESVEDLPSVNNEQAEAEEDPFPAKAKTEES